MNVQDPMIADALLHERQYITQLMELPDSALSRKLGIVRQQMVMAYEKQLTSSLELLSVWERQIIEARALKGDFDDRKVGSRRQTSDARQRTVKPQSQDAAQQQEDISLQSSHQPNTFSKPSDAKPAQLALF